MREGRGNCLRYLKREWNRKEGKGHKAFKKGGGKLGKGMGAGCLKRGGGVEPPYELWVVTGHLFCDYSETSMCGHPL